MKDSDTQSFVLEDLPSILASTYAASIDGIIAFIWSIVAVWFVACELLLIYLVVRYRKREGVRAAWMPADTLKTNAWVLLPCVFVFILDMVIEVKSDAVWQEVKGSIPNHEVLVRVTGRQFAWTFTYAGPDGKLDTGDDFQTASELHVPRGKVVRLSLESVDVIHSFWVPVLRLKQDIVPGRAIPAWFEATVEGRYEIACAELCGPAHGAMRGHLIVHSKTDFDDWQRSWLEQRGQLARTKQLGE